MMTAEEAQALVLRPDFKPELLQGRLISENFTWADVFKNRTLLEIKNVGTAIFHNAVQQAALMEKIRAWLRERFDPNARIYVTCWWRSVEANRLAHGALNSQHLYALATDFIVPGYESIEGNQRVQGCLIAFKRTQAFSLEITGGNWTHADSREIAIAFQPDGHVFTLDQEEAFQNAHWR